MIPIPDSLFSFLQLCLQVVQATITLLLLINALRKRKEDFLPNDPKHVSVASPLVLERD